MASTRLPPRQASSRLSIALVVRLMPARPRRSPRMPVGRNISTSTSTTKATTSVHSMPIPGTSGTRFSTMPSTSPPSMAPRMLPMPPSTAAANAFTPGMNPMLKAKLNLSPKRKPAAPPSMPPMRNVREIVLSMSMPISAAVGASSDTARILRPSLVLFTRMSRPTIMTSAEITMIRFRTGTLAPSIVNSVAFGSKKGGELVRGLAVEHLAGQRRQEERRADRADQEGQFRGPAFSQWSISDALEDEGHDRCGDAAGDDAERDEEGHLPGPTCPGRCRRWRG